MVSEILRDFSETALIRAVKDNLAEFFLYSGQLSGDILEIDPEIRGWHTGIPHPWFNGVVARRPSTGQDSILIQQALHFFDAHQMPVFSWWNDPALPGNSWDGLLRGSGFSFQASTPGMAADLENLHAPASVPDNLTIQLVTDSALLKTWVEVFTRGYPIPEAWSQSFFAMLARLGFDREMRNYLGYLDGKPVATANMFLGAGVAGIYCVATLPEARGQGIGAALTLSPLLDARRMGYRIGILQSSEMGYGIYERLGFQKVCLMEHYSWKQPGSGE